MLTSIAKAFGMDRGPSPQVGATRSVDISGNVLTFAMPENFSRDMPAEDLVTQLDINKPGVGRDLQAGQLIRRWWDIKEPGLFGDNLGAVMMSIAVYSVPDNNQQLVSETPFDISSRFDFIMMIEEFLHARHEDLNEGLERRESGLPQYTYPSFSMLGDDLQIPFWDHRFNGQNWMRYGSGGPSALLTTCYAIPLNRQAFIEVAFTYAPNQGVVPRELLRTAESTVNAVLETLHIKYADGNPFKNLVEDEWQKESVDDVIQRNRDLIVPLFGLKPGEKVPPVKPLGFSED